MKLKKVSGNLLTGLGCTVTLIGLAAYFLPKINNRQLKLVLSSFQTPSTNKLIQLMNNGMNFAMEHCFMMVLIGCGIMLAGILLCISVRTDEEVKAAREARIAKAAARNNASLQANPYQRPQSAARPVVPVRTDDTNPFARYIADGSVPRRTTAAAPAEPVKEPVPQPEQAAQPQEELLTFDTAAQQQPEKPAVLTIQPTPEENHHIHMRPAQQVQPEEAPPQPDAPAPEPAPVPEPAPQPVAASASPTSTAAAAPAQRPVIRSTFRKSTNAQPSQPAPQPAAESTPAQPALTPASRIKSTMGHKV